MVAFRELGRLAVGWCSEVVGTHPAGLCSTGALCSPHLSTNSAQGTPSQWGLSVSVWGLSPQLRLVEGSVCGMFSQGISAAALHPSLRSSFKYDWKLLDTHPWTDRVLSLSP